MRRSGEPDFRCAEKSHRRSWRGVEHGLLRVVARPPACPDASRGSNRRNVASAIHPRSLSSRTTVMGPCSFVGKAVTPIPFSNRDNPELRCYAPVTHVPNCEAGKRLLECILHKIAMALGRSSRLYWLGRRNNGFSEMLGKRFIP